MSITGKTRYPAIDTLKFLMCFAIVMFHYRCVFLGGDKAIISSIPFLKEIFLYGDHAVEFFFIVSGFLIAHGYKKDIPTISFSSFMKRRVKSILAPALLCEIVMGGGIPIIRGILLHVWSMPNFYKWFQSLTFSAKGYIESTGVYPIATVTWYINILLLTYCIFWLVCYMKNSYKNLYIPLCIVLIFFGYVCMVLVNNCVDTASNHNKEVISDILHTVPMALRTNCA